MPLVYSLELGISPGNLEFSGNINERICNNITLNTDYKGYLIGNTKWTDKKLEKREIKDYNLNAEELGIIIDYPEKLNVSEKITKREICANLKKPGTYHGAITYKTEEGYAGVGSWMMLNISKNSNENSGIRKISGMAVSKEFFLNQSSIIKISIVIFMALLLILAGLLFKLKK